MAPILGGRCVTQREARLLWLPRVAGRIEASASPQAPLRPKHSASRTVRDEPRCRDAAPEEGQREVLFFKAFSDGRVTKQVRKQLGLRPTGDSIPDVVLVDAYSHYSYNAYCELYDIVPDRASFFEQGLALPPSAHSKHPLYHFVNEFVRNTLPPSLKKESAKQPEVGTTQLSSQSEAEIGDSAADATEYDSDGYTYAF